MSLKRRMGWAAGLGLTAAALIVGAAAGIGARRSVETELAAATAAMTQTGRLTLLAAAGDPAALAQSVAALSVRHGRLLLIDGEGREAARSHPFAAPNDPAPAWAAALIGAAPQQRVVGVAGDLTLIAQADPADELAEAWDDVASLAAAAAAVILAAVWAAWRMAGLADALRRADDRNRALARRLVEAQDAERQGLARDIHDELGPHLFALRVDAQAIGADPTAPESVRAAAARIGAAAAEIHGLSRRLLARLRPMALERGPLSEALADLVADWRRREPLVDWRLDCSAAVDGCDDSAAVTLYRVAQEATLNAARHGAPSRVTVALETFDAADGPRARLRIADDGVGLNARPATTTGGDGDGLGVAAMIGRARALGGWLTVGTGPDGGVMVTAETPLRRGVEA